MSNIDQNTIQYLSKLCCIHCTEKEQQKLCLDLKKILDYVEQLDELDTTNIPPCNSVTAMTNLMRDDVVGETTPLESFIANAPDHIGGMIRVPPVIKQG